MILLFACSLFFCLSVCTVQAQLNDPGQVAKDAASNHARMALQVAMKALSTAILLRIKDFNSLTKKGPC